MDVSEANFLVSELNIFMRETSKLFAGARILRDLYGSEILDINKIQPQKGKFGYEF